MIYSSPKLPVLVRDRANCVEWVTSLKGPEYEAETSPSFSYNFKNGWICNSTNIRLYNKPLLSANHYRLCHIFDHGCVNRCFREDEIRFSNYSGRYYSVGKRTLSIPRGSVFVIRFGWSSVHCDNSTAYFGFVNRSSS